MDSSAGDLDRISSLPDDLLHAILGFLGDAHAVTSTAVLSRRWRRVWVHAKNLEFQDRLEKYAVPGHFAGFVDWALAQGGDDAGGLDSLKIVCVSRSGNKGCTSPEQVSEWLRYAGRRIVGFLEVQLVAPTDRSHAVELPSRCRATSIRLTLSKHRLRLPAAAAARYEALTELSLSSPVFVGGAGAAGRTLGDLVTSCCPRLRRLVISEPRQLRQLVFRSEALEELEVTRALELRTLDVTAPSLRAVTLTLCFDNPMRGVEVATGKVARIAAPRLEEISMHCFSDAPPPELDIHDLASVRRLDKLWLEMHGKYCHRDIDVGLWLLERCPGVEHVDAWLCHYDYEENADAAVADDAELVDLTAEGAPLFANVRSMELSAWCFPARDLVPSVSSLVMRCPSLRSLRLNIHDTTRAPRKHECLCESLTDKRKLNGKIRLEALEDVEITGFTGNHEETQLVSLLFESSKYSIRRMTLSGGTQIKPKTIPLKWNTAEGGDGDDDDDDDTDTIDEQLMKIPITDRGCWHFAKEVFTWMLSTQ